MAQLMHHDHFHRCPECYETKPCSYPCTFDKTTDDTHCGMPVATPVECDDCNWPCCWGLKSHAPGNYKIPPCPMCGKEDGAYMGSTSWGHSAHCCSDECGHAYRGSEQRREVEYNLALLNLQDAWMRVDMWAPKKAPK